jgi:hypothetical protein
MHLKQNYQEKLDQLVKLLDVFVFLIIQFLIQRIFHQSKLLFHKDKQEEKMVFHLCYDG